jgi:hypothetical protein
MKLVMKESQQVAINVQLLEQLTLFNKGLYESKVATIFSFKTCLKTLEYEVYKQTA